MTLKAVSDLVCDHEVKEVTDTKEISFLGAQLGKKSRCYGRRREPRLPVHMIAQGQPGRALLLRTGSKTYWGWVRLTPWFETRPWRDLVGAQDAAIASSLAERSSDATTRNRDTSD